MNYHQINLSLIYFYTNLFKMHEYLFVLLMNLKQLLILYIQSINATLIYGC